MESDTSSPAGLQKGDPFDPSETDYFSTTFHSVGEIGDGQQYAAGGNAVSGGGFPLEHHHPQQSGGAIAFFPYPEPSGPDAIATSTAMMHAPPQLDWQGGASRCDTALFSPSIDHVEQASKMYYQPDFYGAWAAGAQPIAGLGLTSPHGIEEQPQQPQPQPQPQHPAWGQTMTPPDDSFPVPHNASRHQSSLSFHLGQGFAQLPASNGVSSGGLYLASGSGGTPVDMSGFQYSPGAVGDDPQHSPVTPIDFVDSPSTAVLSPQSDAHGQRHRRPSTSASSPASASTVVAPTRTARASPTSPHEASDRPELREESHHGSTPKRRKGRRGVGGAGGVGRQSNSNSRKIPTSTDDDDGDQSGRATVLTGIGQRSSRARGSNREAAKKCRAKTRLNEQQLEDRERNEKARRDRLGRELDSVKDEVYMWRSYLLMHGSCNNPSINNWISNRAAEISTIALSSTPASQASTQAPATAPSRLQPLSARVVNGRLNFRLQPPPPPLIRRPTR